MNKNRVQLSALAGDGSTQDTFDTEGRIEHVFAAPWAKDADGTNVDTFYELNDQGDLVQVVNHTVKGISYPVVADPVAITPWVFRCLLGLGLSAQQIANAFASGTIWGG